MCVCVYLLNYCLSLMNINAFLEIKPVHAKTSDFHFPYHLYYILYVYYTIHTYISGSSKCIHNNIYVRPNRVLQTNTRKYIKYACIIIILERYSGSNLIDLVDSLFLLNVNFRFIYFFSYESNCTFIIIYVYTFSHARVYFYL